jgi:hypothetical protein
MVVSGYTSINVVVKLFATTVRAIGVVARRLRVHA